MTKVDFEVVKLYYIDQYTGWQAAQPHESWCYSEGYFIKTGGMYFILGEECDSVYVDESE